MPPTIVILKSLIDHSFELFERLRLMNQRFRTQFRGVSDSRPLSGGVGE